MEPDKTRFLSYICPACQQTVIVEKDLFSLAAAPAHIKCPCGKSELGVEFLPARVRLRVPCLYCGREHEVSCPSAAFMGRKVLAFSCAASGLDCCYVGEREGVYAAAGRLERAVDKLEEDARDRGAFLDPNVMEEVLSELRDIAARGGVSCACGSKKWAFQVHYSCVDLVCGACGAQMRIPAATADDLDDLCCQTTLLIHGKKA